MKWWRYIFDERLPRGCKLFPACLSCLACCYGRKLHEKEILGYDREEETRKIIERIKATEVTKAEQNREVARLAAEKAEFDKKRIIAEGEAEAAANRAKVAAGLTPQERAEWDYKKAVGVAEALSKISLPKVIMTGNQAGGSTAMDAMGLKMMTDLVEKMSK